MASLSVVLPFLRLLRENNNTEWFRANRPSYDAARAEFIAFVKAVHAELSLTDPSLRNVDPAKSLFRINRDIRFSANKAPYKNNFAAALAPAGNKDPGAVYYLHLEPDGKSGLAGGIWQPATPELKKIRQEIDFNSSALHAILTAPAFVQRYGTSFQSGDALKRIPAGYPIDHPEAALLKLKSFTAWSPLSDEQVSAPDFTNQTITTLRALSPLAQWLRDAVAQ
jgi:uncharacterized protein (TIGR02453 family)